MSDNVVALNIALFSKKRNWSFVSVPQVSSIQGEQFLQIVHNNLCKLPISANKNFISEKSSGGRFAKIVDQNVTWIKVL